MPASGEPEPPTLRAACFGVLGHPIGHSRSPAMQEAGFRAQGLPHRYLAFDVQPRALREALVGARALGMGGLNLTVPHKEAALSFMDALSPEAERIGAVNTVRFEGGRMVGHNTDAGGFVDALRRFGPRPPTRAMVLGGGGAARAVVDGLRHLESPPAIHWVSRTPTRLPAWPGVDPTPWDAVPGLLAGIDLLVDATSVGMGGGPDAFPVALDPSRLPAAAGVVDLVYPRPAGGLLDAAERVGLRVQDGLPMLLWQGARAQTLWLGRPLPEAAISAMAAELGLDSITDVQW